MLFKISITGYLTVLKFIIQSTSLLDTYADNLHALDTYDQEIDRFTYKANDGQVDSSEATVIIAILTKVKPEYTPSKGEINIIGVSETTFNPLTAAIRLRATKVAFSKDKRDMHILHNHNDVPYEKIKLSGNEALLPPILEEGPNVLDIFALDEQGHPIEKEVTFWAGSHTIVVTVVDHKTDRPITGAVVTLNLGDGKKLNTKGISQNGKVIFKNIPDRHTVFIHTELKTDNNFYYTSSGGFNVRKEKDKIELRLK